MRFLMSWGMLIISVLFNALGVFFIKARINVLGEIPCNSIKALFSYFFELAKSPFADLGLILFALAPFLFAIALSRMEIVVAYPVQIGLNFLILLILALLFLGETITLYKALGIICIIAGILFLVKEGVR